jgi:hypothetical protein
MNPITNDAEFPDICKVFGLAQFGLEAQLQNPDRNLNSFLSENPCSSVKSVIKKQSASSARSAVKKTADNVGFSGTRNLKLETGNLCMPFFSTFVTPFANC